MAPGKGGKLSKMSERMSRFNSLAKKGLYLSSLASTSDVAAELAMKHIQEAQEVIEFYSTRQQQLELGSSSCRPSRTKGERGLTELGDTAQQGMPMDIRPLNEMAPRKKKTCQTCYQKGHYSSTCPVNKGKSCGKDAAASRKRKTCQTCFEKGHYSTTCPRNKEKSDEIDLVSEEPGAYELLRSKKQKTCQTCFQKGHYSTTCTMNRERNPSRISIGEPKKRTCQTCFQKGHYSSTCSQGTGKKSQKVQFFALPWEPPTKPNVVATPHQMPSLGLTMPSFFPERSFLNPSRYEQGAI